MQIKSINYHKVFNLGNYSNEKIGCEIVLEEGDDPVKCHFEAVRFVERAHLFQSKQKEYDRAQEIINRPMDYTGREVELARSIIHDFETNFHQHIEAFKAMNLKEIPATTEEY